MMRLKKFSLSMAMMAALVGWQTPADAQVVPGSGRQILEVGDDFEDPNWTFTLNLPKASSNIDKVDRQPAGFASNGMWSESLFRGTPDFVKRVEAPAGALPGSKGALALQTLYSGIPGQLSNKFQQDDLIASVHQKIGYMLPASWTPSYVVRIYVPPFETWERRVGSSFGFRADCQTITNKPTKVGRFFRTGGTSREMEQYWPGFFFQYNAKTHPQHTDKNTATILIRSGERGQDIPGPTILREGWWTLGMTITPDGQVHYYGHEGVANLTAKDHLYSNFPYGYKCLQTSTYFFNVVNQDDGRSWSTRWIIDDPKVYVATGSYTPRQVPQTAQVPAQPVSQTKPVQPAATSAAPAATAPVPAITPAAPAATPPVAPSAPMPTPPLQAAPPTVTPMPAATPALQGTPTPPLSLKSRANLEALKPLLAQPVLLKPPSGGTASLPPLLKQPASIAAATAASLDVPKPAPALLPELSATPTPAISLSAPAPRTLPVDASTPLISPASAVPPVPSTPEG